ncbi:MAG TPA: alpha/beta hydrolase [Gemmatimonadaceae bacterium]
MSTWLSRNRRLLWTGGLLFLASVALKGQTAIPLVVQGQPAIFAEEIGTVGPTIIVVHGGPGVAHDYLRPEWDQLAGSARLVYYDQRGCGRSARQLPYSWRSHLDDLERVVNSAVGARGQVVLAGSSWGTRLAILFAAEHPERVSAVVLSGTPGWPKEAVHRWRARLSTAIVARLDTLEAGTLVRDTLVRDSLTVARTNPQLSPAIVGRLVKRGLCDDIALATAASWESLPDLSSLTLAMPVFFASDMDSLGRATADPAWDELRPSLSHAERVNIAGGGHDPWFSRPTEFFDTLRRFLSVSP